MLEAFLIVIACTSETEMAWTAAGVRGAYGCDQTVSNPKKGIASRTLLYHAIFLYNLLCSSSRLTPGSTSHRQHLGVSGTWLLTRKERNDDKTDSRDPDRPDDPGDGR